MKKIFIESINNKLFTNLRIIKDNIQIFNGNLGNNIYQIFYKTKFDSIIIASVINESIVQFAEEFKDKKVYIYDQNRSLDQNIIDNNKSIDFILPSNNKTNKQGNRLNINTNMINDQLLQNTDGSKQNYISCFLDSVQILPQELNSELYPNSHKKIKMFNNVKIQHPQNLGIITERERLKILSESEYYLNLDDQYVIEAAINGCKILSLESLSKLKPMDYDIPEYETYQNFIKEYI